MLFGRFLDHRCSGMSEGRPPARDAVYSALERHTWCRPDGATYPMRALRGDIQRAR